MVKANASHKRHDAIKDRRAEPRVPSQGTGRFTIGNAPAAPERNALVIDVSRSGLQLDVDEPIEPASRIKLRLREQTVIGKVGSCRPQPNGRYRIGVVTERVIEHASS